eukprot:TRINITY_DN2817_c0_g1_i1.p1 TRINITY_DN2817_c0_g1~~TRINITY_DN2817_c0_g1_i1.p1  ORF type:complete len:404 (-),score=57.64 TRINITY_DN2817_c0_g1_i1:94-1305(-)
MVSVSQDGLRDDSHGQRCSHGPRRRRRKPVVRRLLATPCLGGVFCAAAARLPVRCLAESSKMYKTVFTKWGAYTGQLHTTGWAVVHNGVRESTWPANVSGVALSYQLSGADEGCSGAPWPQAIAACEIGLFEYSPTLLNQLDSTQFNATAIHLDPWTIERYTVKDSSTGSASASDVRLPTGSNDFDEQVRDPGIVAVVFDGQGLAIASGKLSEPDASELPREEENWAESDSGSTCLPEKSWRHQKWMNFTGAFRRCGPSLVCHEGESLCKAACFDDADCEGFPMRVCRVVDHEGLDMHRCVHKDLFDGGAGADVGSALVFFIISGLALSAGIGGGGLYVPLLMVFLNFNVQEATGLSQALLAGGSATALVYNLRQRHPTGLRPMVDYASLPCRRCLLRKEEQL